MDVFVMLRTFILGDPKLAAALGTRVYPLKLPQTVTYPAMTIQRITGVAIPPLKGRAPLARPRYQFDVWVRDKEDTTSEFADVQRIGRLLSNRLEGAIFTALDTDVTPSVRRIVTIAFETDRDLYEGDVSGGYFRYSADYFIHHETGHGGTMT